MRQPVDLGTSAPHTQSILSTGARIKPERRRIVLVLTRQPLHTQNWIGAKVSDVDALEAGKAGLYGDYLDA